MVLFVDVLFVLFIDVDFYEKCKNCFEMFSFPFEIITFFFSSSLNCFMMHILGFSTTKISVICCSFIWQIYLEIIFFTYC